MRKFRFLSASANKKLQDCLERSKVSYQIDKEGNFSWPDKRDSYVEEDIDQIRTSLVSKWQLLTFPNEWQTQYLFNIHIRRIPREIEWENDKLQVLLGMKHRPLLWNLDRLMKYRLVWYNPTDYHPLGEKNLPSVSTKDIREWFYVRDGSPIQDSFFITAFQKKAIELRAKTPMDLNTYVFKIEVADLLITPITKA
jgi:hypothetical protein